MAFEVNVSPTGVMMDLAEMLVPSLAGRAGTDDPLVTQRGDLYLQVSALDGTRERHEQFWEFDYSVYAPRFTQAEAIALSLDRLLVRYPHRVSSGGRSVVIDTVVVTSASTELPWPVDSEVTRFNGTCSLVYRG